MSRQIIWTNHSDVENRDRDLVLQTDVSATVCILGSTQSGIKSDAEPRCIVRNLGWRTCDSESCIVKQTDFAIGVCRLPHPAQHVTGAFAPVLRNLRMVRHTI